MKALHHYDDYRPFLADSFLHFKQGKSAWSHAFCAKRLGVSRTYFSLLLAGRRHTHIDRVTKLMDLFGLEGWERVYFTLLVLKATVNNAEVGSYCDTGLMLLQVSNGKKAQEFLDRLAESRRDEV